MDFIQIECRLVSETLFNADSGLLILTNFARFVNKGPYGRQFVGRRLPEQTLFEIVKDGIRMNFLLEI